MSVSLKRGWSVARALLASLVVVGVVAFVSTPSFAAAPLPTVTAVSPNAGVVAGGTSVTLMGTGFTGVTGVTFGVTSATSYTVVSPGELIATTPAAPGLAAGIVDVRVTGTTGTSAISATDHFSYQAAPAVTAVSPSAGPLAAGHSVTVTGSGFNGVTAVNFGGTAATTYTVTSSTQLTATAPAGVSGAVDVTVTGSYGTSSAVTADHYTYVATPTVSAVSAAVGVTTGGSVTITGTNFVNVSSVTFGGVAGTSVVTQSATQLTAKAPAHAVGTVDIVVTSAGGTSTTTPADEYTYLAAPTVTKVSPALGSANGETSVTITGTGLASATGVLFGTTAGTITSASATQLVVTSPAHAAGLVDIRVVLGDGESAVATADHFTYEALPVITSVSATTGPTAGGATVTITGTGFTGITGINSVLFGGTPGTSVVVTGTTKITVKAPAGSAGLVNVTVTGTYGTSAVVTADHYTYVGPPTVTSISPALGVITGGGTITVTGTGFTGVTKVAFGTTLGTSIVVHSATQLTVKVPAHAAGAPDVVVTGTYGSSATSPADLYSYVAVPVITSVSNNAGPLVGGGDLTINGSNFTGATGVLFGTTAATVTSVTSGAIHVVVPAHVAGLVDVRVVLTDGTSLVTVVDHYTYEPVPAVSKLTPAIGALGGGTTVTITGTGFNGVTGVLFGTTPATSFTAVSATSITAVVPAGSAGVVDITVVGNYGTSPIAVADHYTYQAAPTVAGLSVAQGVLGGANIITVTGTGFVGVSKVEFGTTASAKVTTVSATQLTVTVPAHVAGTVDVTVVGAYGTSATSTLDHYTYEPVPAVTSISSSAGTISGGGTLTINGTGFISVTKIEFGTISATPVAGSSTQLTVTIPAHAAGTVAVQVVGAYGTSAAVAADQYRYQAAASIAGTVTGPGSVPLGGVQVSAYDSSGTYAGSATTSSTGAYTVTGLGTGAYTLDFTPSDPSYAPQWYSGATTEAGATAIPLTGGVAVTGKNAVLTVSGTISGNVTGSGNAELGDISVIAYDAAGNYAGGAQTTPMGNYVITGLAAGMYSVAFAPEFGSADSSVYAPQSLTDQAVTAGHATTANLQLSAGASVTGTIKNGSNQGVSGVSVDAYNSSGAWVANALTNGSGVYTLAGLAADTYTIHITPSSAYGAEWYDGSVDQDDATTVAVGAGSSQTLPTVVLAAASSISGTVTSSAVGVSGVEVEAYDSEGDFIDGAVTGGDGSYQLTGLPADSYTLEFVPASSAYAAQWNGGAATQAEATPITIAAGGSTTANASLTATGSISGNVFGTSGTTTVTLTNVSVTAYDGAGNAVETVTTDAFGGYTLSGLAAGTYTVDFAPNGSPYGALWFGGATTQAASVPITVTAGQALYGDSITLTGASISGTVSGTSGGLAGVQVYAVDAAGDGAGEATTNSSGAYTISGVATGSYTLEFLPPTSAYSRQYFSGQATETTASFTSVTPGLVVTGRNVTLAAATGSVSGTVKDASNNLLPGVNVEVYDAAGNFVEEVITDENADFTASGLPAGSYRLYADDIENGTQYIAQWYSGKATEATSTAVAVTTGNSSTANFTLAFNGTIFGQVLGSGATDLSGVGVTAYNTAGVAMGYQSSGADGTFQIDGLPAGTYALQYVPESDSGYAPQWYSGQSTLATATKVTVGTSANVTVNPVTLTSGASIAGTVSAAAPNTPANVEVDLYDPTGNLVASTTTDSSGVYTLPNLLAGAYTLVFTPNGFDGTPWWYGQSSFGAQLLVTVTAGQVATGKNVVLAGGASVSGTVTSAADGSTPVPDVSVLLYDATGQYVVAEQTTDVNGDYSFNGVPGGHYVLDFSPAYESGYGEVWSGSAASENDATVLAVGSSGTVTQDVSLPVQDASIQGSVYGADDPSTGLVGQEVVLYQGGSEIAESFTDENGSYAFSDLPAGNDYTLDFPSAETGYADQWWNDAASEGQATTIDLSPGEADQNLNATLAVVSAFISGTVYGADDAPITDGEVALYSPDGTQVAFTWTDSSTGAYSITDLPAGTYTMAVSTEDETYAPYWWNGKTSEGTATPIVLGGGESLTGINPVLSQGASISGTVSTTGSPNVAAPDVEVDVYDPNGDLINYTTTNLVGAYTVSGLLPGVYTVNYYPSTTAWAAQWLGGASTELTASKITILGDQQVTGKNATLVKAATISGTVSNTGGQKLGGIFVEVWQLVGSTYQPLPEGETETSGTGTYTVPGLAPGTYKVGFQDYAVDNAIAPSVYQSQFWGAQPTLSAATAIAVTAGKAVASVNATLTKLSVLAALTTTPMPTITGAATAKVGTVLTAVPGTWAPATVTLSYQWMRGDSAISGATASTYTPTALDVGQQLSVVVTGSKLGYSPVPKQSAPTAAVTG